MWHNHIFVLLHKISWISLETKVKVEINIQKKTKKTWFIEVKVY